MLKENTGISRVFSSYQTSPTMGGGYEIIPLDEILIKFKPSLTTKDIEKIINRFRLKILDISKYGVYTCHTPDRSSDNSLELANTLYERGYVEWAEPNFVLDIQPHDEDPLFIRQWFLHNTGQIVNSDSGIDINAPAAWVGGTGDPDIIVAVLDDGVESHEDLPSSRLVAGFTAGGGNGLPSGSDAHGQAVAGIIAASHNEIGVRGVAPGVKIMSVRVFGEGVTSTSGNIAGAIDTARSRGADVINMSWGTAVSSQISDALGRADSLGRNLKGCVLVASGGNNFYTAYPAKVNFVIAVGAVNSRDNPPWYTPQDTLIDIVAPAMGCETWHCASDTHSLHYCWGCLPDTGNVTLDRPGAAGYVSGDYYNNFGGTSAAAPQVSGVAALLLSFDPDLTADEVTSLLLNSASDYGNTGWDGHGRLQANSALSQAGAEVGCPTYPDCEDPEKPSLDNGNDRSIPLITRLLDSYPNPFNPTVTIPFDVGKGTHVTLTVYDILGRAVTTLVDEFRPSGQYRVTWNATLMAGGVYFTRLTTNESFATQKLVLTK